MRQTEGERTSLDGEAMENNFNGGGSNGIPALPWEIRGHAINLNNANDVNSSTTVVVACLLYELVSDILSRLPIEDVMRYRSVCKGWYALTKDPHFIYAHFSRSLCLPHRILLEPKVDGPITSLYLIDGDGGSWRGRKIPIENMPGNYMFTMCSCQGLLCVASSRSELDPLFIYNPITRECMELPKTDFESKKRNISVGFGFDLTSKKYKVVRLFKVYRDDDPRVYMKGQIITVGEGSWRELEVSHIVKCCCVNAKPVFLNGALHWVIDRAFHSGCEQILSLDLCNEKFRTIKFPSSVIRSISYPENLGLYNLGGSLSLVEHIGRNLHLWRVESTSTKKGYKFYKSSYLMPGKNKGRLCGLKLQDRLIDNSFLFHMVIGVNFEDEIEKRDCLLLYFPEKDEYKVSEVLGVPNFFDSNLFLPSLVSPCHDFGDGAQEVDES